MKKKKNGMAYAYLAPTLITILLVTCLPILYTVILSFTNYNMYHLGDYTFVGADNYLTVFSGSIKSVFFPVLGFLCYGTAAGNSSEQSAYEGIQNISGNTDRTVGIAVHNRYSCMAGIAK